MAYTQETGFVCEDAATKTQLSLNLAGENLHVVIHSQIKEDLFQMGECIHATRSPLYIEKVVIHMTVNLSRTEQYSTVQNGTERSRIE